MLHKSPRITNYFWPKSPMRLTMLDSTVLKRQVAGAEAFNDHDEDGLHNLCGVIDACKVNQKYSSMIDKLEIPDISASKAVNDLAEWRPDRRAEGDVDGQAIRDFVQTEIAKNSDEVVVEDPEGLGRKEILEIVQTWCWSRVSVKKIVLKLQVPPALVRKTIKDYKTRAKQMLKLNKVQANKRRRVVDDNHIEKMKAFWSSNAWRLLTLEDIQKGVRKNTYAGTGSEEAAGADAAKPTALPDPQWSGF